MENLVVGNTYTVTLNGVTHTGTRENLERLIREHKLALHFSETKDAFVPLSEMHINHLANCLVLSILDANEGGENKEATKEILTSIEFQEFVSRYQEFLDM